MVYVYVVDVQYEGERIGDVYSACVQIFGRLSTGESVCVRVRGFRAYFYCLAPSAAQCSAQTAAQAIVAPLNNALTERAETLRDKGGWHAKRADQMTSVNVAVEAVRRTPVMEFQPECDVLCISCSHPCAVPVLRDAILDGKVGWTIGADNNNVIRPDARVFEANLDFVLRFMVDNDVRCNAWILLTDPVEDGKRSTCTSPDLLCGDASQVRALSDLEEENSGLIPTLTLLAFDIECDAELGLFPDPTVDTDAAIQIACDVVKMDGRKSAEIEATATSVLFALGDTDPDVVGADVNVRCFYDEREFLLAFADFIRNECDPDVITSWNGPNFDWKYIVSRCEYLNIADRATRFSRLPYHKTRNREATKSTKAFGTTKDNEVVIPGRVIFDLLVPVRKNYKLRSYKLDAVAEKYLGERKDNVKHTEISKLWHGTNADRGKLGHYCFTTEHQLLTNKGFMFLDEFERRHTAEADLLAASYDREGDTLVYERATAVVVNDARAQTVIEIAHEGERVRWSATGKDSASDNDDVRSNGVSLVVTPEHDMFAKVGKRYPTVSISAGSSCVTPVTSYAWKSAYAKVKASTLASSSENDICRFLAVARNGIKGAAVSPPVAFAERLSLDTAEKVDAFLALYGFWLGDGSMDTHRAPTSGAITFAQVKPGDTAWIIEKLAGMGLEEGDDWRQHKKSASGQTPISVRNKALFAYLFEEYGAVYASTPPSAKRSYAAASGDNQDVPNKRAGYVPTRSARWFMDWVWTLDVRRARLVIGGLRLADGTAAAANIFTSSILFRDELVRLLLHAGYSATFKMEYEAGTHRGIDWRGTPIVATRDAWRVAFATSAQFAEPVVRRARDVREVLYSGKTWCLTMPSGFVIARRARSDAASGDVVLASRPTIQGNCVQDARLPRRLLLNRKLWMQYAEMARVCRVPTAYLVTKGEQIKVFTQLCYKARQRGFIISTVSSNRPREEGKDEELGEGETAATAADVGYQGATVIEPTRGFYTQPIVTLDFASLYPSIMMAHNMCYSTYVTPDKVGEYAAEDITITPTDDAFVKPHIRKGLLPEILVELGAARTAAKKLMAAAAAAGDTMSQAVYDKRQMALKVSANSVYGFTGVRFGRLPLQAIARSVTAFGRIMIEKTKATIEEVGPPGTEVIYGDTDSVMIKYPCSIPVGADGKLTDVEAAIAEARDFAIMGATAVNKNFTAPIKILYEKVFYPYLLINKKRYAGGYFEDPAPERMCVKAMGIESQRRDNALLVPRVLDDVLACLMDDLSPERAVRTAAQAVRALVDGPVTPDQIIEMICTAVTTAADAGGNQNCDLCTTLRERLAESYRLGEAQALTPHTMKEELSRIAAETATGPDGEVYADAAAVVADVLRCHVTLGDHVMSKAFSRPLAQYKDTLAHTEVIKNMAKRADPIATGYRRYLGDRIDYMIIAPCKTRPETYDEYVRVDCKKNPEKLKTCTVIAIEKVMCPVDPGEPNGAQYERRVPVMGRKKKTSRTADRAEDPEWAAANGHVPDAVYYIEKQLVNPVARLLAPLVGSKAEAIRSVLGPVAQMVRPQRGFYPTRLDSDIKDIIGIKAKRKLTPVAQERKDEKEWAKANKGVASPAKRPRVTGPLDAFMRP